MENNATMNPSELLGHVSKVFVIERLGIRPEHHRMTTQGTWIRLAERLVKVKAPAATAITSKGVER
ncbi:hypothetical protein ACFT5D_07760 [Streptomyces sp. NPDC057144]|uniref:hypothetical protein n=1 Tax=Streptomyces sp. NPDC057144 TaxID=3346034 RepID=UPI00363756C6